MQYVLQLCIYAMKRQNSHGSSWPDAAQPGPDN